MAHLEIL